MTIARTVIAATVAAGLAAPVTAATYIFNATVTRSEVSLVEGSVGLGGLTDFKLPDVGATGTVSVTFDGKTIDTQGLPPSVDVRVLPLGLAGFSVDIPGAKPFTAQSNTLIYFSGDNDVRLTTDILALPFSVTGGDNTPGFLNPPDCEVLCTLSGNIFFEGPDGNPVDLDGFRPNEFELVEGLIGDPGTTGRFSFFDGGGGEGRVSLVAELTPVPVPASGALLIGGLVLAGAVARRRSRKTA